MTNSIRGGGAEGGLGGLTCSQGRLTCRHVEPTIRLPGGGGGGGAEESWLVEEEGEGGPKGKKKSGRIQGCK